MLSRVAASLYWLSRYIERSDGMLRMLKINYASSQDTVQEFTWEPVIRIFSGPDEREAEKLGNNSRAVISTWYTGKNNPNSILNIITLARENARGVQEHIPKDLWQCLNEYYHTVKDPRLDNALKERRPYKRTGCTDKTGDAILRTVEITMERGEGPQLYEHRQIPGAGHTVGGYSGYQIWIDR